MLGALQRQIMYIIAWNAAGPTRVWAARWFLKRMQTAKTAKQVGLYYGPGSDMVYFKPGNVTDTESKILLNEIGRQMTVECKKAGWTPGVPDPAFPDV